MALKIRLLTSLDEEVTLFQQMVHHQHSEPGDITPLLSSLQRIIDLLDEYHDMLKSVEKDV